MKALWRERKEWLLDVFLFDSPTFSFSLFFFISFSLSLSLSLCPSLPPSPPLSLCLSLFTYLHTSVLISFRPSSHLHSRSCIGDNTETNRAFHLIVEICDENCMKADSKRLGRNNEWEQYARRKGASDKKVRERERHVCVNLSIECIRLHWDRWWGHAAAFAPHMPWDLE